MGSRNPSMGLVLERMFDYIEAMAAITSIERPVDSGLLNTAGLDSLEGQLERERVTANEAAHSLRTIRQAINRLQALELKAIVAARRSQVQTSDGLVSTGAWVARESHEGGAAATKSVRLADTLESLPHTGMRWWTG